jgi:Flp pilus assembly protein TadG
MKLISTSARWLRTPRVAAMFRDRRGLAAVEFALLVPMMLVAFFGVVEISSGVAVDRKVSLIARTLADLTSQSTNVVDTDLDNFFAVAAAIMTPYPSAPVQATLSELYIDPNTLQARVQWSQGKGGAAARAVSSPVVIPPALVVGGTYLVYIEITYQYVPGVAYVMTSSGVTLNDVAYARPRQSLPSWPVPCVLYPQAGPLANPPPNCPTL